MNNLVLEQATMQSKKRVRVEKYMLCKEYEIHFPEREGTRDMTCEASDMHLPRRAWERAWILPTICSGAGTSSRSLD